MTLNRVDNDLRKRLKEHWSDDAIVELTGLIAFQNPSSKFDAALDVPAQGFLPSPWGSTGLGEECPRDPVTYHEAAPSDVEISVKSAHS